MANDSNVVSFSGQKPPERLVLPQALVRLRDVSAHTLKQVMGSFFDRTDDALFELADRAGSNADQSAYFDAMRELRLRRKSMVVSMLQYVSQAFNEIGRFRSSRNKGALEEIDQDSLSLVDHSELEQQVAIDNLVNKLRSSYSDQIRLLTARVNHLVPSVKLADSEMPLSPEVICGGIAEACADLDIDIRAKLVVLKLFDRLLADTLGDFYQQANRTLIAEGVLPDMSRPPVGPSVRREGVSGYMADPAAEQSAEDQSAATFSELSALLRQGGRGTGQEAASTREAHLDTSRLMARLSEVQARCAQWKPDQVVTLSEQLKPVLEQDEGSSLQLGQVDSDVINLVSMLFDFILEDRQLHPVMKSLIGRLQIPVLKVALSDKDFFNRGGHPVRKLLNGMAVAAMGWTEKRPGQKDLLREKIEGVVQRVLGEYTTEVGLFEELLADFSHFMDLDRRRRELVEQRLRDAEEGRARQERASQAAEELVRSESLDHDIPQPVSQFLQNVWTRYLQWVVLREGEDSELWSRAGELTARLVWSVDPKPVKDTTRSDLLRAIPGIVDELRRSLQDISWDPFAIDSAIRDLELAHVDVLQRLVTAPPALEEAPVQPQQTEDIPVVEDIADTGEDGVPELTPEELLPVAEEVVPVADELVPEGGKEAPFAGEASLAPESEQVSAPAAEAVAGQWLALADSLRVGCWVEITLDGAKIRCKLAAFIKATGKYIFVNRSGAKVAEYYRQDLASAMAAGEIGMLDDGLIFDRALESIIDNLRSSRRD